MSTIKEIQTAFSLLFGDMSSHIYDFHLDYHESPYGIEAEVTVEIDKTYDHAEAATYFDNKGFRITGWKANYRGYTVWMVPSGQRD